MPRQRNPRIPNQQRGGAGGDPPLPPPTPPPTSIVPVNAIPPEMVGIMSNRLVRFPAAILSSLFGPSRGGSSVTKAFVRRTARAIAESLQCPIVEVNELAPSVGGGFPIDNQITAPAEDLQIPVTAEFVPAQGDLTIEGTATVNSVVQADGFLDEITVDIQITGGAAGETAWVIIRNAGGCAELFATITLAA